MFVLRPSENSSLRRAEAGGQAGRWKPEPGAAARCVTGLGITLH